MQNSRLSLDVNSKFVGFDLHGHVGADFLGFAPPNVFVTSNRSSGESRGNVDPPRRGPGRVFNLFRKVSTIPLY